MRHKILTDPIESLDPNLGQVDDLQRPDAVLEEIDRLLAEHDFEVVMYGTSGGGAEYRFKIERRKDQ